MNIFPLKSSIAIVYDYLLAPGIIARHLSQNYDLQGKINPDAFPSPVIGSILYGDNLIVDISDGKKLVITEQYTKKHPVEDIQLDPDFSLLLKALLEYFGGSVVKMYGINCDILVSGNDKLESLLPLADTDSLTFSELKLTRNFDGHQLRLSVSRLQVEKQVSEVGEFPLIVSFNHHFEVTEPTTAIGNVLTNAAKRGEYLKATRQITESIFDQIRGTL